MLKPDKHTNPSLSVVNIAGLIIEELRMDDVVPYEELLDCLISHTSEDVKEVYNYALSFLFLVGRLEYLKNIDALRLKDETM